MLLLTGHSAAVLDVAFSPDATWLASASADSTIRGWFLPGGAELFRRTSPRERAIGVAIAPDGSGLAGVFSGPALVEWWQPPTADYPTQLLTRNETDCRVAFATNRAELYIACGSEILALRAGCNENSSTTLYEDAFADIALGADDRVLALTLHGRLVVQYSSDLSRRQTVTRGPLPGSPLTGGFSPLRGLSVSPDGRRIAFGSDHLVAVWDGGRDVTPRVWPAASARVLDTAFADPLTLLTASADGTVRAWDLDTGAELASYDFGIGEVYCLAVAPGGLTAAAGGANGVAVWDLAN